MKLLIVIASVLLLLLISCVPASSPTHSDLPTISPVSTTATATTPRTLRPSVSPFPAQPTRRATYPPYTRPAWPTRTPGPTCPPELDAWEQRIEGIEGQWIELDPSTFVPFVDLKEEHQFQDYTIRIYEAFGTDCCCGASLEILRESRRVYAANGLFRFYAGLWYDGKEEEERHMPIGQDMTGDGIPDLLIVQWSGGGVHCCTIYRLFQLGEEFRLLGTIDAGDYDSRIADLDGDGNWEFIVHDWVVPPCSRWPCCCGPDPYVILHYENGGFHLVVDLMRSPAPTLEELEQLAEKFAGITKPRPAEVNPEFWDAALDLIYGGHAEVVEPFLKMVWPQDQAKRSDFLDALLRTLPQSLYWPEIKDVSGEWPWPDR